MTSRAAATCLPTASTVQRLVQSQLHATPTVMLGRPPAALRITMPTDESHTTDDDRDSTPTMKDHTLQTGRSSRSPGPVVDIEFPAGALPEINDAVIFDGRAGRRRSHEIWAEVAQHIGENRVRVIAMKATDGLTRGAVVSSSATASPCRWATS